MKFSRAYTSTDPPAVYHFCCVDGKVICTKYYIHLLMYLALFKKMDCRKKTIYVGIPKKLRTINWKFLEGKIVFSSILFFMAHELLHS